MRSGEFKWGPIITCYLNFILKLVTDQWIMVERWNNVEFVSPSLSLSSRDFCHHMILLLKSQLESSDCRFASRMPSSNDPSLLRSSLIFWSGELILDWQLPLPNTSLFQMRKASVVWQTQNLWKLSS